MRSLYGPPHALTCFFETFPDCFRLGRRCHLCHWTPSCLVLPPRMQFGTNKVCVALARCNLVTRFILIPCSCVPSPVFVTPPDPGVPPLPQVVLRSPQTQMSVYLATLDRVSVFVSLSANSCVLCCTNLSRLWLACTQEAAAVGAPAKMSAWDAVMENGWMDGWIFKDLRYLHIRDSSAGMLVCWNGSLRRCCRFVVRVWSAIWPHSFLITGSDLRVNVFQFFLSSSFYLVFFYLPFFLLLCLQLSAISYVCCSVYHFMLSAVLLPLKTSPRAVCLMANTARRWFLKLSYTAYNVLVNVWSFLLKRF